MCESEIPTAAIPNPLMLGTNIRSHWLYDL